MLSAVHTYMHMWSPIFCEVGLQCLLSTTPLLKFFLEQFTSEDCTKDSLTTYFYHLVRKIWSGQFSIVYPRDFKNALGLFHVQFQDYRQVCFFLLRYLDGITFIGDQFSLVIKLFDWGATMLLSLIFHSQFIEVLIMMAIMWKDLKFCPITLCHSSLRQNNLKYFIKINL